jgi:fumarylacetoacetase
VPGETRRRVGVGVDTDVLDLTLASPIVVPDYAHLFADGTLDPLLAAGFETWHDVRHAIGEWVGDETHAHVVDHHLVPADQVELVLPFAVGDFVDFYASEHHATNLGRMFRPDGDALLPNWKHLPVGYHGRSGTLVPSGASVKRPGGQIQRGEDPPVYGPTRELDFELEVGFLTGSPNRAGEPIPIERARDHIFGLVLVNDWSARDIQRWEYQPLGPFLGKSFATSISPWVVTLDALEPYRVPATRQDPPPLPHLRLESDHAYDVNLEVALSTSRMKEPVALSRTNLRYVYWTIAQQLAHATSNGATAEPGDLFASGTISGPGPGSYGSLIELTWRGERPIELPDGSTRTFLEDGDTVVMRGWCEAPGRPRIGFGELRGTVVPAQSD